MLQTNPNTTNSLPEEKKKWSGRLLFKSDCSYPPWDTIIVINKDNQMRSRRTQMDIRLLHWAIMP